MNTKTLILSLAAILSTTFTLGAPSALADEGSARHASAAQKDAGGRHHAAASNRAVTPNKDDAGARRASEAAGDDGAESGERHAASAAKAEASSKKPLTGHGTVNLNQADETTLELLPGVGPKKSERIVNYRKSHPFRKVEDLTKVKGFGRKTLSRLRTYLSITGPSTLGAEEAAPK